MTTAGIGRREYCQTCRSGLSCLVEQTVIVVVSTVGKGKVEIARRSDVPALEVGILRLLAVHVCIFLRVLGLLLRNGIRKEQRAALEVNTLSLQFLLLFFPASAFASIQRVHVL
jgi:hypothetical protein